jgi:membrane protease YdiL (CAAX protease family)
VQADRYRLPIAIGTIAVWIAITVLWDVWRAHVDRPLADTISQDVAWNVLTASIFLVVVVRACRWTDMGFRSPQPANSLIILWFPSIFIGLFLFVAAFFGWPEPRVTALVGVNTLLVGFSEELAFRGVLFRALLTRMSPWQAIWLTTVAFGAVHTLNALTTGEWLQAIAQSFAAGMSGLLLMAIMLRTGSIYIAMGFHSVWDFVTLASVLAVIKYVELGPAAAPAEPQNNLLILPILFLLPNFLYALFLLRKVGRQPAQAPA